MNAAYEMLDRDILQILWDTLPSGFFDYGLAAAYPFFIFKPTVPTAKLSEPIPASYGEEVTRQVKDYATKHNIDQTLALSRLNLAMNCPGHWEMVEPKGNVCPKAIPVKKWEDIFFRIKRIESSWSHRNFIKSEGELRADRPD